MDYLIPITFFVCVVYAIKVVVDARLRSKMIAGNVSDELVRSMVLLDEQQRRQGSLRWGIVLICLAAGFGLLESFRWEDQGPGAVAVLLGATGIGNLVSYLMTRNDGAAEAQRRTA